LPGLTTSVRASQDDNDDDDDDNDDDDDDDDYYYYYYDDGDGDGDTNDDIDIFLITLKKQQHDCMVNCSMGPGYFDVFLKPYIFSHCYLKSLTGTETKLSKACNSRQQLTPGCQSIPNLVSS